MIMIVNYCLLQDSLKREPRLLYPWDSRLNYRATQLGSTIIRVRVCDDACVCARARV